MNKLNSMKTKNFSFLILLTVVMMGLYSCNKSNLSLLPNESFSKTVSNKHVDLYTLKSGDITMQVTNFGGRVVSLWIPDKNGNYEDVVLGHKTIDEYIDFEGERFLGCVVGRYANRIANGQFTINDSVYQLPINNNGQTLHGGLKGLDLVVWDVESLKNDEITLTYLSPDGEEGFPGNLSIEMNYKLTKNNEFIITYSAKTDKQTVINLSNHSFFNLKGEGKGTINDHVLQINGSYITPINKVLIPNNEMLSVENTPFDFRTPKLIGTDVNGEHEQLINALGYDHNWVLDKKGNNSVQLAASLYEPNSGRYLEVWTDQPGLQFYGGNFFDGSGEGKYGNKHKYREAIALETQHFPDSPNNLSFPSTLLNVGDNYKHTCIYKFSVK
jgi:aldose 1-epimerase